MIYDTFEQAGNYFTESDPLRKALDFAKNFDLSLADGRHEIDGDRVYANVMSYETRAPEELKFEAHRKYIDIQILLEGEEFLDVSHSKDLEVDTPYSEEGDAALFKASAYDASVRLEPGKFALLYPADIHRPGRMAGGSPQPVRKMVIKVRV